MLSALKERVPRYESEEFQITDTLTITSYGLSSGGRRPALAGQFEELRRPRRIQSVLDTQEEETGPGSGNRQRRGAGGTVNENRRGRGTFRRAGNPVRFTRHSGSDRQASLPHRPGGRREDDGERGAIRP